MKVVETMKRPRVWKPVTLHGSLTVDTGTALPVLALRPGYKIKGEMINNLSPLPPERHFREVMLGGARVFIKQMERTAERYRLKTPEAEMRIFGPFMTKGFGKSETEGMRAVAYSGDEWKWPEKIDFRIEGTFVAEFGFVTELPRPEDSALIQVMAARDWELAERAAYKRLHIPY